MSGELAIKKVPEVGALRSTENFEGDGASFLLFFFFFEWTGLEAICEWLEND